MIKISYDMRRILKALLNMEGSIQISNTPNGTLINYTYKDDDIYITKEFDSNKYEVGQYLRSILQRLILQLKAV